MRKGPHPLSVHLGMAASSVAGMQEYSSLFKKSLNEHDAVEMVRGIQMYLNHPYKAKSLPVEQVHKIGSVSVNTPVFAHKKEVNEARSIPLLLVPSLVNKSNIMDITEEKSLLRWFSRHGIKTYLLDWGDFLKNDIKDIDFEELIETKLAKAIQAVSEIEGKPIDVLGYCMGGTLLPVVLSLVSDHIRRMILLASPWDFHLKEADLTQSVRLWSPTVLPVLAQRGHLPAEWIQALFASLGSGAATQKFIRFSKMDQDSVEAKLFVAVEDWLNDGVNIPADIAQHCIQEWFIKNSLASGDWCLPGYDDCTEKLEKVLIVASHGDRLVPFGSALRIKEALACNKIDTLELQCGHISLIVGKKAVENVWNPILEWLQEK